MKLTENSYLRFQKDRYQYQIMFRTVKETSFMAFLVILTLSNAFDLTMMSTLPCTVRKCSQCSTVVGQKYGNRNQQKFCKGEDLLHILPGLLSQK